MNPILIDTPMPIKTPRLLMRPPQAGDGVELNKAILESFEQLHQWLPWASEKFPGEVSETYARQAAADWILRKELNLLLLDPTGTAIIGGSGFNGIEWDLPSFHIGYWVRTSYEGQGYITEAVNALTRYAFEQLHAVRVEIRCDEDNLKSSKVAQRLLYNLEANLRSSARKPDGRLRNTLIYARFNLEALPELEVKW